MESETFILFLVKMNIISLHFLNLFLTKRLKYNLNHIIYSLYVQIILHHALTIKRV